ncbi:MAG: hypothetical protein JW969_07635 [Spirochaetales bacterium]|nr:hypothetical protein [Spirochaetales bacterium]
MEIQLEELIEKIKNEGIKTSEQMAEEITAKANNSAQKIVENARIEADKITAVAKQEAMRYEINSKEAIKHAARDYILKVQAEIKSTFEKIIRAEVEEALKEKKVLMDTITKIVESYASRNSTDISVLLNPEDLKALESFFMDKLKSSIKKGLEINPLPEIKAGFKVQEKNSSLFYDFTDKGIADSLSQFVNAKLSEYLRESAADKGKDH